MKFSQTPEPLRKERLDIINHRWKQLYDLETDAGKSALQSHLFLTNAGGAATTLAFIGAIGAVKVDFCVKLSLLFFVAGLILFGISKAKTVHHIHDLFKHWQLLVNKYFNDKILYEDIILADTQKAVEDIWDYVFPYASFACFIIGSFVGFYALI